jgi:Zn-dependent protease with chaperone function
MNSLDQDEVRSILALMVARVAERDSAVCSVAATLAGIPYYFICHPGFRGWVRERMKVDPSTGLCRVEKLLITLMLPIATFTLRLAFDDTLIKKADAMTVRLTGSGATLASALTKIDREKQHEWWGNSDFNPGTSVLFAASPLAYVDELPSQDPFLVKTQRAFTAPFPSIDERTVMLMRGAEQTGGTAVPA